MSWRTSTVGILARNIGRRLGLNRFVARLRAHGYEERYDARLTACIHSGDVVWDIGANIGYYTTRFAASVGAQGTVVAFEPSAVNFSRLKSACTGLAQATLQPYGLGNVSGQVRFEQGNDDLGATSRMIEADDSGELVDVRIGDALISTGELPQPSVIKMDVEGFEGEVVDGLANCLRSPKLRAVGIEVHFGILAQRGLGQTPMTIERMLEAADFNVTWPDSSHILATR
jgi:FkbM family methyltransferase